MMKQANCSSLGLSMLALALASSWLMLSAEGQQLDSGCKIECYPNTRLINNGKGVAGKTDNCRWIMRTDGKPARLCDHITCKKVCPSKQQQQQQDNRQQQQQLDHLDSQGSSQQDRIEQQLGDENGAPLENSQPMGIMRHLHGSKLAKAPVPGLAPSQRVPVQQPASNSGSTSGGRRMAPTLPPSVQYDENDTPPPISRFLDISPEE